MDAHQPQYLMEAYRAVYEQQSEPSDGLYEELVEFLVNEGYAEDLEDAADLIEELDDEEIEGILDEGRMEDIRTRMQARYGNPEGSDTLRQHVTRKKYKDALTLHSGGYGSHPDTGPDTTLTKGQMMYKSHLSAAAMRGQKIRESYDLYDLVLDHLLDEGYADSEQNALKIMSNMSEEWVDSILDEANRAERELGLTSRQRERARNLHQYTDKPIFYRRRGRGDNSDPLLNKAHKRMTKKRQAEHKAGRHTRGDIGLDSRNRYQANNSHTDGYPSISGGGGFF